MPDNARPLAPQRPRDRLETSQPHGVQLTSRIVNLLSLIVPTHWCISRCTQSLRRTYTNSLRVWSTQRRMTMLPRFPARSRSRTCPIPNVLTIPPSALVALDNPHQNHSLSCASRRLSPPGGSAPFRAGSTTIHSHRSTLPCLKPIFQDFAQLLPAPHARHASDVSG